MFRRRCSVVVLLGFLGLFSGRALGQQEIGFIEKFALAQDRRDVLSELIPGTEDYYYYHCLHYQNEGQFPESQAILDAWKSKFGETSQVDNMDARQRLLTYEQNPQRTLDYLRDELGLNLHHAPPARDRAAAIPNSLDNSQLEIARLLESAIAADRSLGLIESNALELVLARPLSAEQLRAVLSRLERADVPGIVKNIAEELSLKDSRGFGWAQVHAMLTLQQLDELLELRPQLKEEDKFIRAYTLRLAPPEGTSLSDRDTLRQYLERLLACARRLPPSQNSFKALVIGNLLRLDMSERKYDRALFLEYLSLPRSAPYYAASRLRDSGGSLVQLDFSMNPQVPLVAMGDDSSLVRRYLEHFLQSENNVDVYAAYLNREYLEQVLAETKILYGLGNEAQWYSRLAPSDQQVLRERVELRFAPHNQHHYHEQDPVRLDVELKHVEQLIIKIFEINTLSYYRNHDDPISTSIDLDGLAPNFQQELEFSQAPQRRHAEAIDLPQLSGRGTWVVDLLGAGQRSRALIQKGRLIALERLGDAGHMFEIVDDQGAQVSSAHIELNGRQYPADDQGRIILPYAEQTLPRTILLVAGGTASPWSIVHRGEEYRLEAGFLIDHQSLVAGTQAKVAINVRLTCNDRPVSIELLEDPQLTIVATDSEGISSTLTVATLDLDDGDELVHAFLVPQRLANLTFSLSGRVYNQNRDRREELSTSQSIQCNGIQQSTQIADFFLRQTPAGYRLLVLGRNGEPIARLPVSIALKLRQFKNRYNFMLATDQSGAVELGQLEHASTLSVSASDMQASSFPLSSFHRAWPTTVQVGRGASIELPLGKETADRGQFSLYEIRRGVQQASHVEKLELGQGGLKIANLQPGDYLLVDHETGQRVEISVGDATARDHFVAAPHRLLQIDRRPPLFIRQAQVVDGQLDIQVSGADAMTRVHIVAHPLTAGVSSGRQLQLPYPPLEQQHLPPMQSLYIDSLRLDEEYSYILDRQGLKKYPGNMLPQPTVLVHPWEVSVTENSSKQAAGGDAIPALDAPSAPMGEARDKAKLEADAARTDWKCYDFLAAGTVVFANLGLVDGSLRIPTEELAGYSNITVIAVHPTIVDSRQVILPDNELRVRDQRLRNAFDPSIHLAQVQKVEVIAAGERKTIGDPKTRRLQSYATVADVFQLYNTLLGNPEWEKFRFVSRWHELSEEEQLSHYNEMGCHELNFFLYHKDRKFFDRVIKPLIAQKLNKQLVDQWLLGASLAPFDQLWKVQRLNTLERILLAERLASRKPGTQRWLSETLQANPLDPQWRQQRFEIALRGSALQAFRAGSAGALRLNLQDDFGGVPAFGGFDIAEMLQAEDRDSARGLRRQLAEGKAAATADGEPGSAAVGESYFSFERLGRSSGLRDRFFQSIDKTREWAETQYYQVRLSKQTPQLIPPNPFWKEFLSADCKPFLPRNLDLPCTSINEALCALAVIDLPLKTSPHTLNIEDEQLVFESESPTILYLESIEPSQGNDPQESVLVGQDVYLASPGTDGRGDQPIGDQSLLTGIPYRTSVVVTNPTSRQQRVEVLTQLPAGSIPLSGSKITRSTPLELAAYSTAQVQYAFYFPAAGSFDHYGAQISSQASHLAATDSKTRRVAAEPESVDKTTWSYVADWGSSDQVLDFLQTNNLQSLDLSRIAFRMSDKEFFQAVTKLLSESGTFEPSLWAYAVVHRDIQAIRQLLQNRPDFLAKLGIVLDSPLVNLNPREQRSYEHLDYRPLVVARAHRLGRQHVILNPSLHEQYHALLGVLAHQPAADDNQLLELCYYLLLQNRIDETVTWFARVDRRKLDTHMQYDYFDAYLDFYRGRYDRAAQIAGRYVEYPVPMWSELFTQVVEQVSLRNALLAGATATTPLDLEQSGAPDQRILTDRREQQQTQLAAQTPSLDLESRDGRIAIRHRNLQHVQVNYYLMDIELLFSRNPFEVQSGDTVPPIRPNVSQELQLDVAAGLREIEQPKELRNRNVLVEATSAGISRSSVITASSLTVTVVAPYGRVQVLSLQGRAPVEAAYVKVFARHRDGSIRFYKDGYTDLRGQFDYATLSTSDLDTAERFAILVLDEELGAVVKEASPPTR